jgi:hypothetical protein
MWRSLLSERLPVRPTFRDARMAPAARVEPESRQRLCCTGWPKGKPNLPLGGGTDMSGKAASRRLLSLIFPLPVFR